MKRILLLTYFSFLTLVLTAQDSLFVLLETDTIFTTSCDSIDYCVDIGGLNPYFSSEVMVNGIVTETTGGCNFDTVNVYDLSLVDSNGPWTVEIEYDNQYLSFTINSLAEIADTLTLYDSTCMWEFEDNPAILICYGGHPNLNSITISSPDLIVNLGLNINTFPLGFVLRLNYGENEIIMTHEDGYADTSIVSVIHEEQLLEAVELNLSIGESETYLAESQCGSEMFTYVNLCEANATGAAELITNGNIYEIKAVSAGLDTVCVQYTDEFGFSKRQDFYLSVLTSTENIVELGLDIYPNPTTDFINILTDRKGELIEIQDVNGQVILSMTIRNLAERLDVSDFSNGIYFLSVQDDLGRKKTNRFVKM